ncbi:MAG TPA: hypothetical protein EYH00_05460 [Archaeoglobus profundus]|nr:hypothetical protein [Archaeoglobus profundus]
MFILSCTKVIDTNISELDKKLTYSVIPFENYSDTPLAGYRIASIIEGVLRAKGYRVINKVWSYKDTDPTKEEIEKIFKKASSQSDRVIYGTVNEFRYKVGIDNEPVVSITIYIYDTKKEYVIKSATVSATGSADESLGMIAQKLVRNLF